MARNLPQPPRLSDDPEQTAIQLREYMWDLYNSVVGRFEEVEARATTAEGKLTAIAAVTKLTDPATATTTEIATAVNAIIDATAESEEQET